MASEEVRQDLLIRSRSQKLEARHVQRAKVILLSLDGATLDEIMAATSLTRAVVNKWRNRFRRIGLEGLADKPRPGRRPTVNPKHSPSAASGRISPPGFMSKQ